ncbi:MAG: DUF6048 family protein [Bacteroidales bacterium]
MKAFTWLFITSICLLCASPAVAQQDEQKIGRDTVPKNNWQFETVRMGVEIGKFSDLIFLPERSAYAGSVELTFSNKYFITFIGGISSYQDEHSKLTYDASGYYVIAGMDRNMLQKEGNDAFTAGLRFGYASFNQHAQNITIDSYRWGSYPLHLPEEEATALWTELNIGIKAEVFPNFFLGWSVQARLLINSNYDTVEPINIPGYGKTGSNFRLAARYSVFYAIPFRR